MTDHNDKKSDFNKEELGRKLKEARNEQGWSKSHVAERAEITPSYLNKIERGGSVPSAITLAKLSKVLEKSIEYFVSHILTVDEEFQKRLDMISEEEKDRLGLKAQQPFYLDFKTKKALLSILDHVIKKN